RSSGISLQREKLALGCLLSRSQHWLMTEPWATRPWETDWTYFTLEPCGVSIRASNLMSAPEPDQYVARYFRSAGRVSGKKTLEMTSPWRRLGGLSCSSANIQSRSGGV